jgi:hypothetical protein
MTNLTYRRAKATERAACELLGKKHLGGPGEPDCKGNGQVVEVKNLRRKVSKYDLGKVLDKSWAKKGELVVASTSGFTSGAKELAAGYDDIFLYNLHISGARRSSRRVFPRE